MIDKDQVKKIAELARIKVSEDELESYSKDLSSILNYVEELNGIDVDGVEPTFHASSVKNVLRGDDAPDEENKELSDKLLKLAPKSEDGYLKVKSILK